MTHILHELGRFPGQGLGLIEAGLQSPVVRCRNAALGALEKWGPENRPSAVLDIVREARVVEPVDQVKETLNELLAS